MTIALKRRRHFKLEIDEKKRGGKRVERTRSVVSIIIVPLVFRNSFLQSFCRWRGEFWKEIRKLLTTLPEELLLDVFDQIYRKGIGRKSTNVQRAVKRGWKIN